MGTTLELDPVASEEPFDNHSLDQVFDCNLMRHHEPESSSQAVPEFMTHKYCGRFK